MKMKNKKHEEWTTVGGNPRMFYRVNRKKGEGGFKMTTLLECILKAMAILAVILLLLVAGKDLIWGMFVTLGA